MKRKKIEVEIPVPEVDLAAISEAVRQLAARVQQRLAAGEPEPSARLTAALGALERVQVSDGRRLVVLTFRGAPPTRAAAQPGPDGLLRLACTCPNTAGRSDPFAITDACGHLQAASAIWHLELGPMPDPQIDTRPWHRARVFLETREILPDFPERFARAWAEWQRVGKPAVLIGRWDPTVLSQAPDDPPRSRTGPRPGAGSTGPRPGAGSTGSRPGTGSAGSRTGTGSTGPRSQYQAPPRPAPEPGDHYALLGVPPTATAEEVRRAYRRLARKYHPDTTTEPRDRAAERFKRITEAYEVLSDPKRRAEYDRRRNKA